MKKISAGIGISSLLGLLLSCSGPARPGPHPPAPAEQDAAARDVMALRYRVELGLARKSPNPQQSASVVVDEARDRFYAAGTTGELCARSLESGEEIWCTKLGGEHRGQPMLTPAGDLLIAQDNGELRWYDAKVLLEGKEIKPRWRFRSPGLVHEAPLVADGLVFIASSRNQVIALDERSGKWRWTYERELPKDFSVLGRAGLTYRKKPASEGGGGVLYTGFDDGQVAAIDSLTGQAIWIESLLPAGVESLGDVDTTPILFDNPPLLVVAGAASGIVALDPKDGSRRWTVPGENFNELSQVDEDRFLAASPSEGLWALDRRGQVLWRTRFDRATLSAPTVYQDLIFVAHDTLGVMVLDLSTGEMLSTVDLHSGSRSRPVVARHRAILLALTHHAWLLAFDLWTGALSPEVQSRPSSKAAP